MNAIKEQKLIQSVGGVDQNRHKDIYKDMFVAMDTVMHTDFIPVFMIFVPYYV